MCMRLMVMKVTIVFTVVTKLTNIVTVTNDPTVTTAT